MVKGGYKKESGWAPAKQSATTLKVRQPEGLPSEHISLMCGLKATLLTGRFEKLVSHRD